MHKETLNKILDLLGGHNEEAAAIEYRKLHERLWRFFEWNGVEDPRALADEAIDRLGRRAVEEAATENVRNPSDYALGIARLLLQEEIRRQKKQTEAIHSWETLKPASTSEDGAMDEALEHCLKNWRRKVAGCSSSITPTAPRRRQGSAKDSRRNWGLPQTHCEIGCSGRGRTWRHVWAAFLRKRSRDVFAEVDTSP
jgi:hypothetical protein